MVLLSAFETSAEADLVEELRDGGWSRAGISLVAVEDDAVIGHVLVTPGAIERDDDVTIAALGLGPIGVRADRQGRGVGSLLMRAAMTRVRARPEPGAFLLGHREYYPRFGFVPASLFRIRNRFGVEGPEWMACERLPGLLASAGPGVFRYAPPFGG